METKNPIYEQARQFSTGVRSVYPEQWLAYNLSPSFNWRAAGLTRKQERDYIWELGRLGFVWQFITLGGLHTTALAVDSFSRAYAEIGMEAYCEMVQEPEREAGVEVLTHQKWSGAQYMDDLIKLATGGISSTAAMGEGVTEGMLLPRFEEIANSSSIHVEEEVKVMNMLDI
jgi:isocitrate lyase